MKNIIIVSQSLYQTIFWEKIANQLNKNQDFKIIILCFDYESEIFLKKKNFFFYNLNSLKFKKSLRIFVNLCKKYKIKELKKNYFIILIIII